MEAQDASRVAAERVRATFAAVNASLGPKARLDPAKNRSFTEDFSPLEQEYSRAIANAEKQGTTMREIARVERFGRRGTEPFEQFEPYEPFEFFLNRIFF